jgi:hypothetical protein
VLSSNRRFLDLQERHAAAGILSSELGETCQSLASCSIVEQTLSTF